MRRVLVLLAIWGISWTLQETSFAETNVWTNIGPEGGTINILAVDPQNPRTVYAGSWFGGIYKSTNAGSSWVKSGPTAATFALVIDPSNPAILYSAGTGIFKSSDGGASWNEIYRDVVWN